MLTETGENQGLPSITADTAILVRRDGQTETLPLNEKGTGENANASCFVTMDRKDKTVVFSVRAEWKELTPSFKAQPFFKHREGISLKLNFSGKARLTAIYQHKDWWLRPAFVSGFEDVPGRTQLLIWKERSEYRVLMALCASGFRTDFTGTPDGLTAVLSSNCEGIRCCSQPVFGFAWGENPYTCIESVAKALIAASGVPVRHRSEKTFPALFEHFGWCSWDAFYQQVNEGGILEKLRELKEKDLLPGWVLIDDGWSQADYSKQKLQGFGAASGKFPDGLEAAIRKIKSCGVQKVGVWQAVMGYWNGIEKGSEAAQASAPFTETLPDGRLIPASQGEKSFGFWNLWHALLRDWGVDFVKVDSQSAVSIFYEGHRSYGEASRGVQLGLAASAAVNFDGNIINCMGMAPEEIWNRPAASLARNSDDFVPDVPFGFREHAIQNGYNSLLHGQFYWGDWDMFWSSHAESRQNAILRAVSGGPVYISDKVGETDSDAVRPLIFKDGRVLRCEQVGVPTLESLLEDPVETAVPLKLFNTYGQTAMVAAFHVSRMETSCHGSITLEEIPAITADCCYLYDGEARSALLLHRGEAFPFCLQPGDARIFLLIPFAPAAALGLTEKYLSPAAVTWSEQTENQLIFRLYEEGNCGVLSGGPVSRVLVEEKPVSFVQKGHLVTFYAGGKSPTVRILFGKEKKK